MGKRAARKADVRQRVTTSAPAGDIPVVSGREPCPCGSGRRYKACHGRESAQAATALVHRPFEGLAAECDWVALREIVPAATAPLTLRATEGVRPVTLATLLPLAWPALVRVDGEVLLGVQTSGGGSGDPSRDLGAALEQALTAEPGDPVGFSGLPGAGPRLQDLLDPQAPLEVTVHDGFDFWVEGLAEAGPEVRASMERANASVVPTRRLDAVEAAYWCRVSDREHLRWVLPYDEEPLLDAMARVQAARADRLGEGSRYVGAFRAHGLVVPVWDLPSGTGASAVEEPAAAYLQRLHEALEETRPLSTDERRARAALQGRQLTLR